MNLCLSVEAIKKLEHSFNDQKSTQTLISLSIIFKRSPFLARSNDLMISLESQPPLVHTYLSMFVWIAASSFKWISTGRVVGV